MSMEESISLEETNKIRISLGLKPLTEDAAPADDKDRQAEDNYAKRRERETKEREAKKIQDRIDKVRNRRELNASLKGSTLGDVDGDVDDTLKWIKRSKKKEKELAKKRQEELESMDKAFQEEYTERDLVGLKVSHDFDEMDEGDARILTLKDSRILDNEEDELQNIEMAEDERTKKNRDLKIKRHDYTGYDDEEFMEGKEGLKRSVLAKYDEDINGTQETGFRLGHSVVSSRAQQEEHKHQYAASVNKSLLSIDYAKNLGSADYLMEGDIGFKKPKTKKKRPSRRAPIETDLVISDQMDVDEKPIVPRVRDLDTNFVDDDELQAALARSRKAKLHRAKKLTPEQLAKKISEQRAQEEQEARESIKVEEVSEGEGDDGGLTFDDTSEFVRAVGNNMAVKSEPKEVARIPSPAPRIKQRSPSRDVSMAPGDVAMEEVEAGEIAVKEEEEEDEMAMLNAIENAIAATEAEEKAALQNGNIDDAIGGTSTEQTFSSGMASTLTLLRQQGILATPSADQKDRERTQLQRDLWLAEQRQRVAQRELERLQSRGANKDQAQREYENRMREQQEARDNLEAFKNYKPDVNIVYYDEFGRALNVKEAWKALSHKFHGKGSGKMKTEKRLKKIAEEKKKEAMASGDTPLSMNSAFQQRQLKAGQAHFVLSVGNRGAVPQVADFLDAQPLTKGKTEKAKKKKEGKNAQHVNGTGFMTLPAPQGQLAMSGSPAPSGFSSVMPDSISGSPAPKPGFSRISSAVDSPSQGGTPVPAERSKVAFGFGTKRKAGEDALSPPPPKRRG
ncbi:U4/U6.U5 tri-snRNP-associated protein 1 [Hypsizygus marmoreus]|uniref:U4/U6.U5 tri-snRNP-associated protein 1 n=1 Tax=Hypsizygus marmoreus TaxID=39966 RepID=A0A369JYU9_HYPMA|nr:U4/U6.U5 tri-snRNP-associated protein 1 [Hypsizygus marmoreus]